MVRSISVLVATFFVYSATVGAQSPPGNPACATFEGESSCAVQYAGAVETYCTDRCDPIGNNQGYKCKNGVTQQLEYGPDWNLVNRRIEAATQGISPVSWHLSTCYTAMPCKCKQIGPGLPTCVVDTDAQQTRGYRLSGDAGPSPAQCIDAGGL